MDEEFDPEAYIKEGRAERAALALTAPPASVATPEEDFDPLAYIAEGKKARAEEFQKLSSERDEHGQFKYSPLDAGAAAEQAGNLDERDQALAVFKDRARNHKWSVRRAVDGTWHAITGLGGVAAGAGSMLENIKSLAEDYTGDAINLGKYYLGGDKQKAMAELGKTDKSIQASASDLTTATTGAVLGLGELGMGAYNFGENRAYDIGSWFGGKGISDEALNDRFDRMVQLRAVRHKIEDTGGIEGWTAGPDERAADVIPLRGDETPEELKKVEEARRTVANDIRGSIHEQEGAAGFGLLPTSLISNPVTRTIAGGGLRMAGKAAELAGNLGTKGGHMGTLYGIFSHSPEITAGSLAAKYVLPPTAELLTEAGNSMFTGQAIKGGFLRRTAGGVAQNMALGGVGGGVFGLGSEEPEDMISSIAGGMLAGPPLMLDPLHHFLGQAQSRGSVMRGRAADAKELAAKIDRVGPFKELGERLPSAMPEHSDGMNMLSKGEQDTINYARGTLATRANLKGDPTDVVVLPEDVFVQTAIEHQGGQAVDREARGFVSKQDGNIYLNAGATDQAGGITRTARHETGHVVTDRLTEILGEDFKTELGESMRAGLYDRNGNPTPEFKKFIDNYSTDIKGRMKREDIEKEYLAETVNHILEGKPLEEWAIKTGLGDRLRDGASDMLKKLGIKPKAKNGVYDWEEIVGVTQRMKASLKAMSEGSLDKAKSMLSEIDAKEAADIAAAEAAGKGAKVPETGDAKAGFELSPEAKERKARREALGLTTETISKARQKAVEEAVAREEASWGKRVMNVDTRDEKRTQAKWLANKEFDQSLERYMGDLEDAGVPHPRRDDLSANLRLSEISQSEGGYPKHRKWGRHANLPASEPAPGALAEAPRATGALAEGPEAPAPANRAQEAPEPAADAQERLQRAQADQEAAQELGDPEMIAQAEAELAAAQEAAEPATSSRSKSAEVAAPAAEAPKVEDAVDRRNRQSRIERELAETEARIDGTKVGSQERMNLWSKVKGLKSQLKEFEPKQAEPAKVEEKRSDKPATDSDIQEAVAIAYTDARREHGTSTAAGARKVKQAVRNALLEIADQDAGTDTSLLRQKKDGSGYSGRLDLSLASHRAIVDNADIVDVDGNLKQLNDAIGTNIRLDYGSAPKLGPSTSDVQRRAELAASNAKSRKEGGPVFQAKGKPYIPTHFEVTKDGNVIVRGFSPEKLASNIQKILDYMRNSDDPVINKYIEKNYKGLDDPQIQADILGYIENHKFNRKGDGSGTVKGLEVPPGAPSPYIIPRNKFDVLNAAMHGVASTKVGGESQKMHERGMAAHEKAIENDWLTDDGAEDTNPLREAINRSEKAKGALGEDGKSWAENHLESTAETLSPELIDNVTEFGEGNVPGRKSVRPVVKDVKAGIPDWSNVEAGFMPKSSRPEGLLAEPGREVKAAHGAAPEKKEYSQKEYDALLKDPARLAEEHKNDNGVRVLNGDSIIAANPRMQGATPAESLKVSGELYPEAKAARDRAFTHLLDQPIKGDGEVLFMAGGMGSGKSTVAKMLADPEFIYDTNLKNFNEARDRIDEALDSGRNVTVALVAREPGDAMRGNVARAMTENRVGSAADLGEANSLARQVAKKLAEHYKGNDLVKFTAYENVHGEVPKEVPIHEVKDISIDDASDSAYNTLHEIINGTDKIWKGPKPSQEIIDAAYGKGPRKGQAGPRSGSEGPGAGNEGKVPAPGREAKGALAEPTSSGSKSDESISGFMPKSERESTKEPYREKDKRTGHKTLIVTKRISREDAQELSSALRQTNQQFHDSIRKAVESGETEGAPPALPPTDLEKLGFKLNPKTNTFQHDESSGLKRIGGGGESRTYGDGRVAYKVFYPQIDFEAGEVVRNGGIGIEGYWEQRPDGTYKIEHRTGTTGSLLTKLHVLSAIGGIPSEVVGETKSGAVVIKQPDARNYRLDTYADAKAGMEAKAQLEPVAETETIKLHPSNRITVVDGKPYILSDLNESNTIADTKGNHRMLDPVVSEVPQEIIDQNPELAAQIERMKANESDRIEGFMPKSTREGLEGALADTPNEAGKAGALSDKKDSRISVAINPGYARKMNPGLSYEQAQDLTRRVMSKIAPDGKMTFLENLGIDHTIEETIGQFEGKPEPSMVIKFPGKSLEDLSNIGTLMGHALLQDSVIPHEFTPEGENRGLLLSTGTGKMSKKIEDGFRKWAESRGQDFTMWKDGDEIMIFDPLAFSKKGYDAEDFKKFVDEVEPMVKELGLEMGEFRQNSEYIDHETYTDRLKSAAAAEGSSDLFEAARRDLYQPASQEFKSYFDKLGEAPEGEWPDIDQHLKHVDEHGITRNKSSGQFMSPGEEPPSGLMPKSERNLDIERENENKTTKQSRAGKSDERDEAGDLEAALAHVRGDQEGPGSLGGNPAQTQRRALARWAVENGREIDKIPSKFLDEGAEHGIWNGPDGRTWKVATGGGLTPTLSPTGEYTMERGTPEQYLERLRMNREVVGDTTRLEGVHIGVNGIPKVVVSQKTVDGPHPSTQGAITDWMEERGFERARYGDYTYFNKDTGVAIFDAHTDNFRKDRLGNLIPIDVATIKPEGEMLNSLRKDVGEEGSLSDQEESISGFMPKSNRGALEGEEAPKKAKRLIWSKIKSEAERKRIISQRINDYKENFPEALPLKYLKDENGKFILNPKDQKPKAEEIHYNLSETPLALKAGKGIENRKERRAAIAEAYSDEMVKHVEQVRNNPAIKAGEEWYRVARTKIKDKFGDDAMLFAQLLGATSPNTNVKMNYKYAIDAYNQHKSGAYDGFVEKYLELEGKLENGDLTWKKDFGKYKKGDPVTGRNFREFIEAEGILPLSPNGKKLGMHSKAVLNVLAGVWEARVGGPKTPNFARNLYGASLEATIDVWAARNLHRLGNEGHGKKPWRIPIESEQAVTNPDFYLAQDAYRRAAKKLGMNADDLQGLLWFAEKDIYDTRKWTKSRDAEKADFNQLLDRTVRRGDLMEHAPEETVRNKKKNGALVE